MRVTASFVAALFVMVLGISVDAAESPADCRLDFEDLLIAGDWERVDAAVDACIESRRPDEVVEHFCISVANTIRSPEFTSLDEDHQDRITGSWKETLRRRRRSLSVGSLPLCDTAVAEAWESSVMAGDFVRTEAIGRLVRTYSGQAWRALNRLFDEYNSNYSAEPPGLQFLVNRSDSKLSICQFISDFFENEIVMGVEECPSTASTAATYLAMVAIECFKVDFHRYPYLTGVDQAEELLTPVYVKQFPRQDAWGNPLIVHSDSTGYEVRSLGADGVADQATAGKISQDPNVDIVWTHEGQVQQHDLEVLP